MWVLRTKFQSSGCALYTYSHRTISLAPQDSLLVRPSAGWGVEHSQDLSFTLSSGLWALRLPQRLLPGPPLALALASEQVEGDGVWHTLSGCVTLKQSSDGS